MILLKWADNPSARLKIPFLVFFQGEDTDDSRFEKRIGWKKTKITHGVVICRLYPNLLFLKRSLRAWQHGHERLSRGYYIIPWYDKTGEGQELPPPSKSRWQILANHQKRKCQRKKNLTSSLARISTKPVAKAPWEHLPRGVVVTDDMPRKRRLLFVSCSPRCAWYPVAPPGRTNCTRLASNDPEDAEKKRTHRYLPDCCVCYCRMCLAGLRRAALYPK